MGIFILEGGNCSNREARDFFLFGHHQSQHFENFSLATFLKEPVRAGWLELVADVGSEQRNDLWLV